MQASGRTHLVQYPSTIPAFLFVISLWRYAYKDKLVGHSSSDSTEIIGREKACCVAKKKPKIKKKRGRKSKAERAAMTAEEIAAKKAEVETSRLDIQPKRSPKENLEDLPQRCDWGCKRNSKGKIECWLPH